MTKPSPGGPCHFSGRDDRFVIRASSFGFHSGIRISDFVIQNHHKFSQDRAFVPTRSHAMLAAEVIRTWVFIFAAAVSAMWLGLMAWASLGRCYYRLTPSPSTVTSFHADVHSVELMHSWINRGEA